MVVNDDNPVFYFRHADLYFNATEYEKAVNDLCVDKVYDQVLIDGDQTDNVPGEAVQVAATQETGPQDSFTRRR